MGGPVDYTWRYRGGQEGYDQIMPALMRWGTPGAYNHILAVTDSATPMLLVGRQSLTLPALQALESFYRRHYGDNLMYSAWRIMLALAHIYVKPTTIEPPTGLSVGKNCQLSHNTHYRRVRPCCGPWPC